MKGSQQFIHQSEFTIVVSVESWERSEEYGDMAYDRDALPSELANDSSLVTNEFSDSALTDCKWSRHAKAATDNIRETFNGPLHLVGVLKKRTYENQRNRKLHDKFLAWPAVIREGEYLVLRSQDSGHLTR
jgi:hypothetical protein